MNIQVADQNTTNNEKKLITVASGKGGVGKTWFSVTFSHALASKGRKVLLFDGDLGLANVDIQLGITPEMDVGSFITGDANLASITTRFGGAADGFDIIPGKSGSGSLGALSSEILAKLHSGLVGRATDYDHVILDLAAGLDPSVTTLSNHAGTIIVVMTADPTSLTDAYAFIKVTATRHPGSDIRIVVNNVPNRKEGEKAYDRIKRVCEGFLKISPPLVGIVRHDPKVTDSIRAQVPLFQRHTTSDAGEDMQKIMANILKSAKS